MKALRHAVLLLGLTLSGHAQAQSQELQPVRDCEDCPELVLVPAGEFTLGSSRDDYEHDTSSGETPGLRVRIRRPFWIGRHEVTRREWSAYTRATGAPEPACGSDAPSPQWPVTCLSGTEIEAYLRWLTARAGQTYRLPSESEWEYAARAGSSGARHWSNRDSHEGVSISRTCAFGNVYDVAARDPRRRDPHARCTDGFAGLAPVGRFQPNDWGLHDTLGNARERTADCYTRSYKGRPADERAWRWETCRYVAVRGGSYLTRPFGVRSAARDYLDEQMDAGRAVDLGFRVVREVQP